MSNLVKKEKGFTLIEIVLVLAIAGLLLVIVFLAVSGAQKSRRDTQRKNDAGAYVTSLESYASNNSGAYPATGVTVGSTYFTRKDPGTGSDYTISGAAAVTAAPAVGTIGYALGYVCNGQVGTTTGAGARNYAVVIGLEQGGSACYDNH